MTSATESSSGRLNIGVTPYRGDPRESRAEIDSYYASSRYRGFERSLREESEARGVQVESVQRVDGIWDGDAEPSASVWLHGDLAAAREVGLVLGRRFNQDAVFTFTADPEADGVIYTLPGVQDIAHARTLLARYGVTAARLNGHDLEIASADDSLDEAVNGVAHELGVEPEYERGHVDIVGRENYG